MNRVLKSLNKYIIILFLFIGIITLMIIPSKYTIIFTGFFSQLCRKLIGHFFLCFIFTFLVFFITSKIKDIYLSVILKTISVICVIFLEIMQKYIPTRYFTIRDLVINIYGLLTGILVYFLLCILRIGKDINV